jgi:hypothetical protein
MKVLNVSATSMPIESSPITLQQQLRQLRTDWIAQENAKTATTAAATVASAASSATATTATAATAAAAVTAATATTTAAATVATTTAVHAFPPATNPVPKSALIIFPKRTI